MVVIYQTVHAMAMPFTVSLAVTNKEAGQLLLDQVSQSVLTDLKAIENKFSVFKEDSLVSHYRSGDETVILDADFQEVYLRSLAANAETGGAFDPFYDGSYNPTGLVKGWAIEKVFGEHLKHLLSLPYVEAVCLNGAGDMQLATCHLSDFSWKVGIERADNSQELLTRIRLKDGAIATSGYSKKGRHIIGAKSSLKQVTLIATSLTQADIWATALLALPEEEVVGQISQYKLSGLYQTTNQIMYFQHGVVQDV